MSIDELNCYEKLWHTEVYQVSWDQQATKVIDYHIISIIIDI